MAFLSLSLTQTHANKTTCRKPFSERPQIEMKPTVTENIQGICFVFSFLKSLIYLFPSASPSSSELKSIVNMSSSSENSSPLSSLLPPPLPAPPSGRGLLLLFLLFLVIPPSLCCAPRFWTGSELQVMESGVYDVEMGKKHTHTVCFHTL